MCSSDLDIGVIDGFVGADLAQLRHLLFARSAGDDMRAQQLAEFYATGPHPARRAQNDDLVAGLDRVVGDEHPVRGAVGDGQRGGLLEAHAAGHGDELVGGDEAIFLHAAVEHFAHQALFLYAQTSVQLPPRAPFA